MVPIPGDRKQLENGAETLLSKAATLLQASSSSSNSDSSNPQLFDFLNQLQVVATNFKETIRMCDDTQIAQNKSTTIYVENK